MVESRHARRVHVGNLLLLLSVFVVGICTIIYELLIGSVSSYLVGDSIKQFSITIGLSMSAMGVGTYVSRLIKSQLPCWFIGVELALSVVGGLSVPFLYGVYLVSELYYPAMVTLIVLLGVLIGIEIPLLTRMMSKSFELRANISNVLSLDYLGALLATLLFPFVLLPFLGVFRSSLVTGLLNLGVAGATLWFFRADLKPIVWRVFANVSGVVAMVLVLGLGGAGFVLNMWEASLFDDRVIYSQRSSYQKIVLTRNRNDLRMYLNGHLQFSSVDEHRYHESLVHVPIGLVDRAESVLVLGGGDGLAARELLKYSSLRKIVVVDLDPMVTELARGNPLLAALNGGSLASSRIKVVNRDAFEFLETDSDLYDVILADLPDPNSVSLSRLYSREFYNLVYSKLSRAGVFVTQATSPFFASEAFWCVVKTLQTTHFKSVLPYHAYVPSMGDWGFVLATKIRRSQQDVSLLGSARFVDDEVVGAMFVFPEDLKAKVVDASSMNDPKILRYYLRGWKQWN